MRCEQSGQIRPCVHIAKQNSFLGGKQLVTAGLAPVRGTPRA
jgi:hypothetical protein